jgi:hypothetical protein
MMSSFEGGGVGVAGAGTGAVPPSATATATAASPPQAGRTFFADSSHPWAAFFHLFFRTSALLVYLLCSLFTDEFVVVRCTRCGRRPLYALIHTERDRQIHRHARVPTGTRGGAGVCGGGPSTGL